MASELAQRAAAAKQETSEQPTARDVLLEHTDEFKRALGSQQNADHFVRGALTALTATPELQEVTESSLMAAVLLAAQLKLEIGAGLNQFHLTPRTIRKKRRVQREGRWEDDWYEEKVCVPIIGYQGFVALGYRHPKLLDFQLIQVRAGDEFDRAYTTERGLAITWRPKGRDEKGVVGRWEAGVIRSKIQGGGIVETYMDRFDVEGRRPEYTKPQEGQRGAWTPNTPWKTHWDAMADKTVMREHAKYIPKAIEMERALALDGRVLKRADDGAIDAALRYEEEFSAPPQQSAEPWALEAGKGGEKR